MSVTDSSFFSDTSDETPAKKASTTIADEIFSRKTPPAKDKADPVKPVEPLKPNPPKTGEPSKSFPLPRITESKKPVLPPLTITDKSKGPAPIKVKDDANPLSTAPGGSVFSDIMRNAPRRGEPYPVQPGAPKTELPAAKDAPGVKKDVPAPKTNVSPKADVPPPGAGTLLPREVPPSPPARPNYMVKPGVPAREAVPKTPKNPYEPLAKDGAVTGKATEITKDGKGVIANEPDQIIHRTKFESTKKALPLYEAYASASSDKAGEKVRIPELHKGVRDRVASVELLTEFELMEPDRHGLILHPTGMRSNGHLFALARDANQIPVNIIEYTMDGGKPKYLQQWIFDRSKNPDTGEQTTSITHFREASATAMGRPPGQNGGMVDVYMSKTEYVADNGGNIVKAAHYNNLNKPTVQIEYGNGEPRMFMRDASSGNMRPSAFSRAYMTRMPFNGIYLR